MTMPIITLGNGLRVGNFSSPHSFLFTTGEVLPACTPERARGLMLEAMEQETQMARWMDIRLYFGLSSSVVEALDLVHREDVDIILVPLPVLQAADRYAMSKQRWPKIRTTRCADRVTKAIYPDRFCLYKGAMEDIDGLDLDWLYG